MAAEPKLRSEISLSKACPSNEEEPEYRNSKFDHKFEMNQKTYNVFTKREGFGFGFWIFPILEFICMFEFVSDFDIQ